MTRHTRRMEIREMKRLASAAGHTLEFHNPVWLLINGKEEMSIGVDVTVDEVKRAITGMDSIILSNKRAAAIYTHKLYTAADFTEEEIRRGNKLAVEVIENDMHICKRCGEYESGLWEPCKQKTSPR